MTQKPYPGVPKFSGNVEQWIRQAATVINNMLVGSLNVSDTVTLTANAASTTVTDARCSFQTGVVLIPTTANAAAAIATTYISETSRVNGSFVLTHANNAQTDRTFRYVLMG